MPRHVALYARVSTTDQRLDPQLDALRAFAVRSDAEAVEFTDHGVSGARDRRPGLDAMLRAVRRREVGVVVVCKLDRLARSTRHLCELAEEFQALGCAFVVLDQAIDTSTLSGRLLFQVLGAVAEFERGLIVERVTAGLASAKRRGVKVGRPRALDPEQVARLQRLHASGMPQRRIAELLGCSKGTISAELAKLKAMRQAA